MSIKHQDFQLAVERHSLDIHYLYASNALAGEVGEVCNVTKKIQMSNMKPEWIGTNGFPHFDSLREMLNDELGDALFYLTRLALTNGTSLAELQERQIKKLKDQSIKYGRTFLK